MAAKARLEESELSVAKQMLELYLRRSLLLLHIPFAIQADKDPRYSYSRHVCLDNAGTILAHYKDFADTQDLRALCFKDEHAQAAMFICLELFLDKPIAGRFCACPARGSVR